MIEHFSTRQVGRGARLDYWNQLLGETYTGLIADTEDSRFDARLARWRMGDVTLTRPTACALSVTRRKYSSQASGGSLVVAHLVHEGEGVISQRELETRVGPGDMILCAAEEAYRIDMIGNHELLIMEIDRALLAAHIRDIDACIGRRIPARLPTLRLLRGFLLSLWREGYLDWGHSLDQGYENVLASMLGASLRQCEQQPQGPPSPLVERMKMLVEARVDDPQLTPASLAMELGVSLRKLQATVADAGTTPVSYIAERRLELAANRLATDRNTPITEVAFDCGFTDSSYFARRFHKRFGLSPRDYRARH